MLEPRSAHTAVEQVHAFWSSRIDPTWAKNADGRYRRSPFDYWADRAREWPVLSAVAQQLLLIQASSAETERLWSMAGSVCSDLRSRLAGDRVNQLVFVSRNIELLAPVSE